LRHINSQVCTLGKTPSHLAVETKNIRLLRDLLLNNALTDIADDNGDNVYHYAARLQSDSKCITEILLTYSKRGINQANNENETPLLVACKTGNFYSFEVLLTNEATVDVADNLGYPIHHLFKNKQLSTSEAIFKANPNQGHVRDNKHGGTPLHWAKDCTFINLVLKHDCEINAVSKTGDTALHIMVRRQRFSCLMTFLCAGADPNIKALNGDSPLHTAVKAGSVDMIYALIVFGAQLNVVNESGETPRHLAAAQSFNPIYKSGEILCSLHSAGAKRCPQSMKGCSKGCAYNGSYDGKAPVKQDIIENQCHKVFEEYIDMLTDKIQEGMSDAADGSRPLERKKDTVLCLDGGGVRGLILVQILMAVEKAAGRPIAELFDWIVGTSTGGILALAIAKGYCLQECRKLYFNMKDEVFEGTRPYKTDKLEAFLKDFFGEEAKMDSIDHPKVLISCVVADRIPPVLHFFRNYDPPCTSSSHAAAHSKPFDAPAHFTDQLVWQVARASGAAPSYFRPMGRYLDGGLIANNPTLDALTEIHEHYIDKKMKNLPTRSVGLVLSIGTGVVPRKAVKNIDIMRPDSPLDLINAAKTMMGAATLGQMFIELVTDSVNRAVDRPQAWCGSLQVPYFRFSPPISVDMPLDESRDVMLLKILWETECYIKQNEVKIKKMVTILKST
ncbi:85/88 kDa calcium-independent phospholipase A2-like, partial [Anneissia japonica]|uniref:85/88 kDa calcium-independent phospholipase A2-like n=1 Tax=Anneissia japonica TaxID=1529436 RepID=UPI0014259DF8